MVIVLPSLFHCSGRIVHRFIPIGKILKPVLLECVSPVTCYWSLSLLLRGEAELMLVFETADDVRNRLNTVARDRPTDQAVLTLASEKMSFSGSPPSNVCRADSHQVWKFTDTFPSMSWHER
ncbi:hypothetical protein H0E87_011735 [Populus deltoides]|uniref:Phosphatidylinositol N-acetylglucosaminyltransferase subunit H conserved domain-containing protein n=1 Tax=Populus deltoides TaxID=3696 RepID=A0A8T2YGB0_POPDE|nr:hypothetical protein H0E87_011735 [Populus deltoides]